MAIIDNLISYYKLDDASGAITDSHGTNVGTNNGATYSATGKINTAMSFDGSTDYIALPDIDDWVTNNKFSICCWINGTDYTSHLINTISSQKQSATDRCFVFDVTSEKMRGIMWNSGGSATVLTGTTTLSTGTWYFVSMTYDGTDVKLYVNGVEEDSASLSGTLRNSDDEIWIGRNEQTVGEEFKGIIDELGLWAKNLTALEIKELYNYGHGFAYPFVKKFTIGEKELKTDWPHESGLTAETTKQTGRITNLVAENSIVPERKTRGLR